MDTDENRSIEPAFQNMQRLTKQMRFPVYVQRSIISLRLDPFHIARGDKKYPPAIANREALLISGGPLRVQIGKQRFQTLAERVIALHLQRTLNALNCLGKTHIVDW